MKKKQFNSEICGCFITFESDKDVKKAQKLINDTKIKIFDKELKIERAREPSDY